MPISQSDKATSFRALHQGPRAFVIANAWDAGSARVLAALGFPALATSSGAQAGMLGKRDGTVTRDEALAHCRAIAAATELPVSADLEKGFGDTPAAAAETIRLAGGAGLVGGSIEDATGDKATPLYDIAHAVERVAAAVQAARALPFPFTLTARAEGYLRGNTNLDDAIKRLQAFEKAGADVLMAPGLPDLAAVRAVCGNRGKHALPLDLRHPDAREILEALLARADVVLTNMRPGLAAELGLEYEQVRPRHPRLVVGNVTAFGARGPDAALAGMDLVVQGRSGLMVTGGRVKDGLPTAGESPIADYMAAALLAFGVASALYRRERTGRGGRVDTSLLLAALALQNNLMVRVETLDAPRHAAFRAWLAKARTGGVAFAEQVERMPRNRVVASQAIYIRTYATKDGALAVACGSPSLRRKFIAAIGHEDPALKAAVSDVDGHYAALRAAVEATLASRTTREWKAVLDAAGVPVSGVALPIEILDDPQPAANAMFQRFEHGTLGPVTVLGPPGQIDAGGFVPAPPSPPFGSEVRAILAWAGFAERDVERLLAGGAVTPTPG